MFKYSSFLSLLAGKKIGKSTKEPQHQCMKPSEEGHNDQK